MHIKIKMFIFLLDTRGNRFYLYECLMDPDKFFKIKNENLLIQLKLIFIKNITQFIIQMNYLTHETKSYQTNTRI